jgi:hypothetical protein
MLNPEDGGSIFLRNVGFDLKNYTAPKTKNINTNTLLLLLLFFFFFFSLYGLYISNSVFDVKS